MLIQERNEHVHAIAHGSSITALICSATPDLAIPVAKELLRDSEGKEDKSHSLVGEHGTTVSGLNLLFSCCTTPVTQSFEDQLKDGRLLVRGGRSI